MNGATVRNRRARAHASSEDRGVGRSVCAVRGRSAVLEVLAVERVLAVVDGVVDFFFGDVRKLLAAEIVVEVEVVLGVVGVPVVVVVAVAVVVVVRRAAVGCSSTGMLAGGVCHAIALHLLLAQLADDGG